MNLEKSLNKATNNKPILSPKIYQKFESLININDRRFKLHCLAGTNNSCLFKFHGFRWYAYYSHDDQKWNVYAD